MDAAGCGWWSHAGRGSGRATGVAGACGHCAGIVAVAFAAGCITCGHWQGIVTEYVYRPS